VIDDYFKQYKEGNFFRTTPWKQIRKIPQKITRTFELTDDEFEKVNDFINNLK
jgi:hypothetical protein